MLFSTDFGANFATQKMGCEKLYCCKGVVVNYLTRDLLSTCIFKNQQLPSLSTPLWLCSFVLDQEQCDKNNIEQLEIMDYQGKKSSLLITLRTLNFSHLSIFHRRSPVGKQNNHGDSLMIALSRIPTDSAKTWVFGSSSLPNVQS